MAGSALQVAKAATKHRILKVLLNPPTRLKKGHGPALTTNQRFFALGTIAGINLYDLSTATNYAPNTVGDFCLQDRGSRVYEVDVCVAYTAANDYVWTAVGTITIP